jgi:hypothetical protein
VLEDVSQRFTSILKVDFSFFWVQKTQCMWVGVEFLNNWTVLNIPVVLKLFLWVIKGDSVYPGHREV